MAKETNTYTIAQLAASLRIFELTSEMFLQLAQDEVNKMYKQKMLRIHPDRNACNPFADDASKEVTCAKPILDYWIAHKSELETERKPSYPQHAPTKNPSSHSASSQPPCKTRHTHRQPSQFINTPCRYGTGCTIKPDGKCKYLHFSLEPCKNGPDCKYKQSKLCVYNH
jgi:hypothetical protein